MKLFQIIAGAQGGRAFINMGQAFGFSDELMARTVRYFIPPIGKAIERRAGPPEGLLAVLEFLGSRRFDRFLDDPRIFAHAQVREEGKRILDFLFLKDAFIQKMIAKRAEVLPIEPRQLELLFPVIAVMALGAIDIRTRRPLGAILHRLMGGALDERAIANPYLALAQHLKKQEQLERARRRRRLFAFLGGGTDTKDKRHTTVIQEPAARAA